MVLRELRENDAMAMLEWMHDPEIQRCFREGIAKKSLEDVIIFIRQARVDGGIRDDYHFAIADEKNDEYLGTVSLKNIDMASRTAEYAISLRRKAQGRGIAYSATVQILRLAFEEMGLERIYLNVLSENERAIRLYERIGFILEGEFRKHLYLRGEYHNLKWYGMLQEDYWQRQEERL